jgi:ATP/maltotriose-dependent transcriptional regulator MalT
MHTNERSIVGRDTELDHLDRLLRDAVHGEARFAVLTGEPGIGKSSLIGELRREAEARGCLTLSGRATEMEQELPFGPVVDAFDAYLQAFADGGAERLATDDLRELVTVFPSLRALQPEARDPTTPAERFRAHHAVRELIERLAARQPLVLALDDLHWADRASLELVAHLLRRPPEAAVLVVLSFRTGRASPALVDAIEAGARERTLERLALGPLDPGAAEALVQTIDAAERDQLYRDSGGNPFYLLQLARRGAAADGAAPGARDADGVPAAVSAAIATELEGLSPPARAFVQAAAAAGDPFDLDLAADAARIDAGAALDALDELLTRDLLRPGDIPRRFRFRHPLVRSAVYASCPAGTRLVAHERLAAALAQRGEPAVARAHHVEQSARHGDVAAVAVLREAARATTARAPASAAAWIEAALRLLPASAPPDERAGLLVDLARARAATGRFADARAALLQMLALDGEAGRPPRVEVVSMCSQLEHRLGRHEDAHDRLRRALDELPEEAGASRAAIMIGLADDAFWAVDYAGMRGWGTAALELARGLDDRPLHAAAAAMVAMAESFAGPVADAVVHHDEAAALVDAMSDAELSRRLDAVANLVGAEFYLDRYAEGTAHARRGLVLVREAAQDEFFPMMTQALGNIVFSTGRLAEAAELLDGAVDAARMAENPVGLAWGLLNRSYSAVLAGDTDVALRAAEEAVAIMRAQQPSVVTVWAGDVYAAALLEAGEARRAADVLLVAGGDEELSKLPGGLRAGSLEVLTRSWLALGRQDDAEHAAARADAHADAFGLPLARIAADRALAEAALAAGDAATAAERALASAARADDLGGQVEAAISRTVAGRALAAAGDADAAATQLEHAARDLEACGAPRRRDRAERELRRLGRTVYRRTRPGQTDGAGVASLTGRELEIARLVVDRRTNPEIAAELFLSIKTVETHMRNIFRKLDCSSRVAVARTLERDGVPE